jgi:hypothetical protein
MSCVSEVFISSKTFNSTLVARLSGECNSAKCFLMFTAVGDIQIAEGFETLISIILNI